MNDRPKGSRNNLRGAAQLELFPREALAACAGGQRVPLRTSHGHAVVQSLSLDEAQGEGGDLFQLVAVWHDRKWDPLRVFKRADGASVVVFKVGKPDSDAATHS